MREMNDRMTKLEQVRNNTTSQTPKLAPSYADAVKLGQTVERVGIFLNESNVSKVSLVRCEHEHQMQTSHLCAGHR